MTAKLIPIVTTAPTIDAVELAQTYIHRWPAQENVIKDYLLPLGLDTNHGFAKVPVENSEVPGDEPTSKQRLTSLSNGRRAPANEKHKRANDGSDCAKSTRAGAMSCTENWVCIRAHLELQGMADYVLRREIKERKAVIEAELEPIRAKEWRAYEQCNNEFRKQERYCKEQRDVLRALEDLEAKERTMYELDHRKDQVMTVCKVALANLAMWTRDQYFPASYAHATWHRLPLFFQLPGTIMRDVTTIHAQLSPFNDRALNRDLALLCERVNAAPPKLPDGRQLQLTLGSPSDPC